MSESSSEWIEIDGRWAMVSEIVVGVFMLALGAYGLQKAHRNREVNRSPSSPFSPGVRSKLKRKDRSGDGDENVEAEVVEIPNPLQYEDSSLRDSLAQRMEEYLDAESLQSNSDNSNEGIDADEQITKILKGSEESGPSNSFVKVRRPSLMRASLFLHKHAAPENSITATDSSDRSPGSGRRSGAFCTTQGTLALLAGVVHGVAGIGDVLGVVPRLQLQDAKMAMIYLGVFCLTSTLVMGCFTAFYGSFSEWLAGGRYGSSVSRVFVVEVGSAFLSIAVGIICLVLLSIGSLEEIFP
ncbi:hypothetical protein ACHAXR_005509 [Thalassiosira sp. AJA248-18]